MALLRALQQNIYLVGLMENDEMRILTPKGPTMLKWVFEHLVGFINRRNDLMPFGLCVGQRIFVYLSDKANFIINKFVDGEL